jgi:Glycosyltransferase family 87
MVWNRRWIILSFLGFGLFFFYLLLEIYGLVHKGFTGDFSNLFHAAYALKIGTDPYQFTHGYYFYPPFLAFIFLPLTAFSIKTACLIWQVVNFSLILLILILSFRIITSRFQIKYTGWQAAGACSLALLLCYHELWWEIKWAQFDLLILAGFTISLYWLDRKPYVAGIILGIITFIKYQPIVFIPYFICRARLKLIMGILAGIMLGMFLPICKLGWQQNFKYLKIAIAGFIQMPGENILNPNYLAKVPQVTWSGNISVTSGLTRVFLDHGLSKHNAFLIVFLIAVFTFLLLWKIFRHYKISFVWRKPGSIAPLKEKAVMTLEYFLLMLSMLIFSPQCTMRHLVMLMNVHLLAVILLLFPRQNVKRWPLLLGVLCYQFGKLFDDLVAHPLHLTWSYFGGPAWCLLIFLPLLVFNGLSYIRDVFQESSLVESSSLSNNAVPETQNRDFEGMAAKGNIRQFI